MKTLLAVGFIWVGCVLAWVVLGSAIVMRTGETTAALHSGVQALWGPPRVQVPPRAFYRETIKVEEKVTQYDAQNRPVISIVERDKVMEHDISLERSEIVTRFSLEHRRKGLLWVPTYGFEFRGRYVFQNNTPEAARRRDGLPSAERKRHLRRFHHSDRRPKTRRKPDPEWRGNVDSAIPTRRNPRVPRHLQLAWNRHLALW
jgi:hypothetical protein